MTQETEYISCADTAKLVRNELKRQWPAVKFSVRSKTYSGGASIDISWLDGPREPLVEPTAKRFEGADFDGMIDLKTSNEHWLAPDGTVTLALANGTEGSRGVLPRVEPPKPIVAKRVQFMADYIFCNRHVSNFDELKAEHLAYIREHCATYGDKPRDFFGNDPVDLLAQGMTHDRSEGEDITEVFRRVVLRER